MSPINLPIPSHFDSARVGSVWRVPYQQRAEEAQAWAREHGLSPAAGDETRIALLLVDVQNTFCLPDFELFVAGPSGRGALEDNVRLCEFIYRNLGRITRIAVTLDTHKAMQIFHPVFWVDEDGNHPVGGQTIISAEDVRSGVWKVNPAVAEDVAGGDLAYLKRHAEHYVATLDERGKFPLLVWPYHALLSGISHALVSAIDEAVFFHTIARRSQAWFEIKGDNPLTEHYSALGPEVMQDPDGRRIGEENTALIENLLQFDHVLIAGQAKSHCVNWTVRDLLSEIEKRDSALARKFYLLEDCTSPVVVPNGPDFTGQADEAFERFAEAGMNIVRSTDPLDSWPGMEP